ncbi:MAG: hypothetical protein ACHQ9S_07960 [Candidatus Binatia bacterium]
MSDAPVLPPDRWLAILDRLFAGMIEQQHNKVLQLARRIVSDVTPEDLRNPQDFPQLSRDPVFNYEDGILAGLRGAHIAVRAELRSYQPPSGNG